MQEPLTRRSFLTQKLINSFSSLLFSSLLKARQGKALCCRTEKPKALEKAKPKERVRKGGNPWGTD